MKPFLTARWESLLLLNYVCPSELLCPYVPRGTHLDRWDGHPIVSLVGFMFRDTRVRGVAFPFHRTFEEVNLRFYVTRRAKNGDLRRGVVFIRELVPRAIIAWVARQVYNEPYLRVPMTHRDTLERDGGEISYQWRASGASMEMSARVEGAPQPALEDSEAQFITEHYWGYTAQRDGGTMEYEVVHPSWDLWTPACAEFRGDARRLYGPDLGRVLAQNPRSAFVAVGSAVSVYPGQRLAL